MTSEQQKNISKAVGALIARARTKANLTQDDVAASMEVGPETISRIERGMVPPTLARLFEFAELFGCRVDELLLEASNRDIDQAAAMVQQIAHLHPRDRELVATVVKQLTEHFPKQTPSKKVKS